MGYARVFEYKTITQEEFNAGNTINMLDVSGTPIIIAGGEEWTQDKEYWVQLGEDIDGEYANEQNGYSVSMNSQGNRVVIGSRYNNYNNQYVGQVRVFEYKTITQEEFNAGNTINTLDVSGTPIIMTGGKPWNLERYFWVQIGEDINLNQTNQANNLGVYVFMNSSGNQIICNTPDTGYIYDLELVQV
jgi:hypothetical protein